MAIQHQTLFLARLFNRPGGYLAGAFLALIACGAVLLSLPVSQTVPVHPLDALFTATSAVCVTGLIVVDTGHDYTRFGQTVILVLIQFGGLGIMTFAAVVMQVAGRRISFRSQFILQDVFYQRSAAARLRRNLKWIVLLTLVAESIGAVLLYSALPGAMARGEAAYVAVFHAISAFCNAGFSTFSDSLISLRGNFVFVTVVALLIVSGGLGHTVILETAARAWHRLRGRPNPVVWSLNTRVVVIATIMLIVGGAAALSVCGLGSASLRGTPRLGDGLFQSITARTAGFNTVDISRVPLDTLLLLTFLMFVGGSPGSCAGGVKTTTLAIWIARLRARLGQHDDVTIRGRRIPMELVRRTGLLVGVAAVYNLLGIFVLAMTEMPDPRFGLEDLLFEQVSAFGTVGLSTGLTAALSVPGKLWIIATMFIGRLGPLTIALVVVERKPDTVRLPEERLMIG